MNLIQEIVIAAEQHQGQTDKGGKPYITHPLRVMLAAGTEEEEIVAVLHDAIQNTPYMLEDLRKGPDCESGPAGLCTNGSLPASACIIGRTLSPLPVNSRHGAERCSFFFCGAAFLILSLLSSHPESV